MSIKNNNLVEKSNVLNTLMSADMGLTELRFFCLYLSKLNARNPNKRTVDILISEFENFFDVKVNTTLFTQKIRKIMGRTVEIRENGQIRILTLYSEFCWKENESNIISITCNDKMLPYLFKLQGNYTKYMIGNIAKLNSVSKIRLYEILKQYEKIGTIKISIEELKLMLCSSKNSDFRHFRTDTLEPAIKDINQYTDIQVSYEKVLSCRKVVALTFTINKKVNINEEFPLQIEKPQEKLVEKEKSELSSTFEDSYLPEQLENLLDIAKSVSDNPEAYLKSIYYQIKARGKKVSNLYSYTLAIINADLKNVKPKENKKSYSYDDYEDKPSYDLDAYIEYNRKMIDMLAEPEPVETEKPIEPIKVEQEEPEQQVKTETQEIKFEFILDEQGYVSFDCCRRLQCILTRRCSRYYKDDTYWLLEEPHTQEEIVKLVWEKHQLIVKPEETQENDFDEIFNSDFEPF